jgi:hypothetical protein
MTPKHLSRSGANLFLLTMLALGIVLTGGLQLVTRMERSRATATKPSPTALEASSPLAQTSEAR